MSKVILGGAVPNRKLIAKGGIVRLKGEKGEDLLWSSLTESEKIELLSVVAQIIGTAITQDIAEQLGLKNVAFTGSYNDLLDAPVSLPASDVPAWAKQPNPPTKTDVGLENVSNDAQVKRIEMGANNGVATLDLSGKLQFAQMPTSLAFLTGVLTRTTMASMPITNAHILVSATVATAWSWATIPAAGQMFHILLKNTGSSDFTQPIPNAGSWDSNNEATVVVKAGSYVELSCWYVDSKYIVIVREP